MAACESMDSASPAGASSTCRLASDSTMTVERCAKAQALRVPALGSLVRPGIHAITDSRAIARVRVELQRVIRAQRTRAPGWPSSYRTIMKVVIFGSSGMVGQGILRESLLDPGVARVTTVVRSPSGQTNPKLTEIVHQDVLKLSGLDLQCDACFFAIGVTSAGMTEEAYTKVTHDTAISAANAVLSPQTTFIFVSGAGADGNSMWARVKRRTEQDLQALPFKGVYVFRPAFIEPMHGIKSRTRIYNALYAVLWPLTYLVPVRYKTTTERLGRAMLNVARAGFDKKILESNDINRAAGP